MAFKHTVLALDLSLNGPGFAVLAISDGQPLILEKSSITPRAAAKHGEKLTIIGEEITRYFDAYKPEHVVRERGFSRFAATTQALYKVVSVSDVIAYKYGHTEVEEIAATSVKKAVTGNGRASKQDVQDAVERILRIDKPDYFANDDESDACAVGIAFYKSKGLIEI